MGNISIRRFQTNGKEIYEDIKTAQRTGGSMPKETVVTYERVAEVAESLLAKGIKPTVDAVMSITGGRRVYVWRHLKAWSDKKKVERQALINSAIDERFAKIVLEDREKFARAQNALKEEEVEILEDGCASMEQEIVGLCKERDELASVLSNAREEIKDLEQGKSTLEGNLNSSLIQAKHLQSERDAAVGKLEIANKRLQGLRESLGQAKAEVKTEREGATKLLSQLETANIALADTQTKLDSAVREVNQLRGEVNGLTSQVQLLREDFAEENRLRIEAMTACATEKSRADTLQKALDALNKPKPPAKPKAPVLAAASATK